MNRLGHSGFKPDEPFGAARSQSGANHSAQSGSSPGANRSGRSGFSGLAWVLRDGRSSVRAKHSKRSGSKFGTNRSVQSGFKLGVSPSTRSDFNPDADHLGIRISSPPNHSKRSGSSPGANHSRLSGSSPGANHSVRPGSKPSRIIQNGQVSSLAALMLLAPCIAPLLCLYSHKARMY